MPFKLIMNRLQLLRLPLLVAVMLAISGCITPPPMISKEAKFPLFYEEKPHVIMVLPPTNATTAADAKEYYSTTVSVPLAYSGFYVIPMEVTNEILKAQGLYDTEMIADQPLDKFYQYFGADAVLFTKIVRWDTVYVVLAANLTVSIEAKLKSARTNRELWAYSGTVVVDLTGNSSTGNIVVDLIAKAVVTAVAAAATDYVPIAQSTNFQLLSSMPTGKYHFRYGKDKGDQIRDLSPSPVGAASSTAVKAPTDSSSKKVEVVEPKETPPIMIARAAVDAQSTPPRAKSSNPSTPEPGIAGPKAIEPSEIKAVNLPEKPKNIKIEPPHSTGNGPGLSVYILSNQLWAREIESGSAADAAGIRAGDEIVSFGGNGANFETMKHINNGKTGSAEISWRVSGKGEVKRANLRF